jgi:hypothetical protein
MAQLADPHPQAESVARPELPPSQVLAGFTFFAVWLLLQVLFYRPGNFPLNLVPNIFQYGGGALLVVLWTNGAVLNQLAPLPSASCAGPP